MAALRHGISTVIIPKDNEKDIAEIADEVKENVSIVLAKKAEDVLKVILERDPFEKG